MKIAVYLVWMLTLMFGLSIKAHAFDCPAVLTGIDQKEVGTTTVNVIMAYQIVTRDASGNVLSVDDVDGDNPPAFFPIVTGAHCIMPTPDGGTKEFFFYRKVIPNNQFITFGKDGQPNAKCTYGPNFSLTAEWVVTPRESYWAIPVDCKNELPGNIPDMVRLAAYTGTDRRIIRFLIMDITLAVKKVLEVTQVFCATPQVAYSRGVNTYDLVNFITDYNRYCSLHANQVVTADIDDLIREEASHSYNGGYHLDGLPDPNAKPVTVSPTTPLAQAAPTSENQEKKLTADQVNRLLATGAPPVPDGPPTRSRKSYGGPSPAKGYSRLYKAFHYTNDDPGKSGLEIINLSGRGIVVDLVDQSSKRLWTQEVPAHKALLFNTNGGRCVQVHVQGHLETVDNMGMLK